MLLKKGCGTNTEQLKEVRRADYAAGHDHLFRSSKSGPDEIWTPTATGVLPAFEEKITRSVYVETATVRFFLLTTSGVRYAVAAELPFRGFR